MGREREVMAKYTVHGSFENPNTSKSYARFSSKLDYETSQEAQWLADEWTEEKRYAWIWIEETK
jgi:hypothetical protein